MATVSSSPPSNGKPYLLPPRMAPPSLPTPSNETLLPLHLSFSQDRRRFTVGTRSGFRVYSCDPLRELFRSSPGNETARGVGAVEMLFCCNIFALVGGGPHPLSPTNKVMIWDDQQSRCIAEFSFRSEVKAVRLRMDRIVVVQLHKILVYKFEGFKLLHQIETTANHDGLCSVSQNPGKMILVCPGLYKGQMRVEHYDSNRTKFISAHDSHIACLTLSRDGRFSATASSKGTLVRIFNTMDGSMLQEVRRGADTAAIYSISFSTTADRLTVSSDKGTVHVFKLNLEGRRMAQETAKTALDSLSSLIPSRSLVKGVLPRFLSSERSFAQFRLPEGVKYIAGFGDQKNTIVILGMDGSFYRCQFNPDTGGEMTQLEHHDFLKQR